MSLQAAVKQITGIDVRSVANMGGGCINKVSRIELADSRQLIVKEHSSDHFGPEAAGLQALVSKRGPRIPEVIGHQRIRDMSYLVLEYIPSGRKNAAFFRTFGHRLASLHLERTHSQSGFHTDNYIGATVQRNSWTSNWPAFFAEHRLNFQLELAGRRGLIDYTITSGVENIISRISYLLPVPAYTSLLHGDLWGGNYLVDSKSEPVLIDPAVYYGHFEADLAMTELFGGFTPDFYEGYNEVNAIPSDYKKRRDLYNLYHMLNHLNLFGASYAQSVKSIIKKYI